MKNETHANAATENTMKKMPTDYEQTMTLNETKGMLRRLAAAEIKFHGFYSCMVEGKKTVVLPDA